MAIELSIIIVNYRSLYLLGDCIETIVQNQTKRFYEIIVVNNDDRAQENTIFQKRFPFIRWIDMGYNAGFARANNEGMRQARGEVFLLLNPDILVEDNSITQAFERLKQSNYGGAGIQLLNPDRTPQISGSYFIRGGVNHFLPLPVLGKLFKSMGRLMKVKDTSIKKSEGEMKVDWLNGAFIMVKKSLVEKAGMLDEDFFLYAEEIEWCSRISRHGQLVLFSDLHVIHLQGEVAADAFGSEGKGYHGLSDKKGRQIMISNFLRIRKQFGVGWFLIHLLVYTAEIPFYFVLSLFKGELRRWKGFATNVFFVWGMGRKMVMGRQHFYRTL